MRGSSVMLSRSEASLCPARQTLRCGSGWQPGEAAGVVAVSCWAAAKHLCALRDRPFAAAQHDSRGADFIIHLLFWNYIIGLPWRSKYPALFVHPHHLPTKWDNFLQDSSKTPVTSDATDANVTHACTRNRSFHYTVTLQAMQLMQLMQLLQLLPKNMIFPLFNNQMCAQTQGMYDEWLSIRYTTCYNWCNCYKYKWRIPVIPLSYISPAVSATFATSATSATSATTATK